MGELIEFPGSRKGGWNERNEEKVINPSPDISPKIIDFGVGKEALEKKEADLCFLDAVKAESVEDFITAKRLYNQAIEKDPDHAPSLNNLACILLRNLDVRLSGENAYKYIIELLERAIELKPSNSLYLYNMAITYDNMGPSYYPNSEEYYLKAISIDPTYGDPYYNIATLYSDMGQYQESIDYYTRFLDLSLNIDDSIWKDRARQAIRGLESILKGLSS